MRNDDRITFDAEEDLVGKPLREHAAKVTVVDWELFWRLFQPSESVGKGGDKLVAQSGSPSVIPVPRFVEVDLRGATDRNAPPHSVLEERTLRSTSRHGIPGSPSRSNSAKA